MTRMSPELINLFWTSAGALPGESDFSRFPFAERVRSAAKAGFKGIGIWHGDLERTLQRRSLREMRELLVDYGLRHVELEFLTDWFLEDSARSGSDRTRNLLLEAAAALGARHIKVGDFHNRLCPMPRLVEAFAELCAEAKECGTSVGLEIMGCSVVNTLADGLALVEAAGAENGGLIIDVYQVVNLGIPYDALRQIPLDRMVSVELNDGTAPGSAHHDASHRRLCGEGDYDLRGYIQTFLELGYEGPWGVEVISPDLAKLPAEEASRLAFETTTTQFEGV